MQPRKTSSRATHLLNHYRLRGLGYPTPRYWERFYLMLEEEAEKRGRTPPPPPLTYGLDHDPTEDERTERLRDQVSWADRNSLLHRVQMFFQSMPPSAWTSLKK